MRTEESSNKNTVIIAILILALLLTSGYIIYDKVFQKETLVEKEEQEEKEVEKIPDTKEEILETCDLEVISLISNFSKASSSYCGVWDYYEGERVEPKDLPLTLTFEMALAELKKSGIEVFTEGVTFTKDQLDGALHKLFGKSYFFEHQTITTCPKWEYNQTTGIYTVIGPTGCGGTCGPYNLKRVVKALQKGNTIEIYVRVIFMEYKDSKINYYSDYKKTNLLSNIEKDWNGVAEDVDTNYQQGSLYKLIFTNEDGNYVFTSSTLEK